MDMAPSDQPDQAAPIAEEHGPLSAQRIPPTEYDRSFLQGLQANGQVRAVGSDWNGDVTQLPPQVNWILHPNGDLERIGFN